MKLDFREFDKAYNEDIDKRIKEVNEKQARRQQGSGFHNWGGYVLLLILTFLVGIKVVTGYVELNNYKYENAKKADEVEALKDEINELRLKIDNKHNSQTIETIAREQLGMVHPDVSQKRVLNDVTQYSLNPMMKDVIVKSIDKTQASNGQNP
ncbi:cell division protein FtsL [Guggenheimella bovis]